MKKVWLLLLTVSALSALTVGTVTSAVAQTDGSGVVVSGITPVTVATGTVTFQVDMSVRICEGNFTIGDQVSVPGSFNGWTPGATVAEDLDGDSVYTATAEIEEGSIEYKFHDGNDWESVDNRMYTVVAGQQFIPVVFFNNDDVCNPPTMDVPVVFQVDMSVKMVEGSFTPPVEWVGPRGSWQGWSPGDTMTDGDGDSIYTVTQMIQEGSAIEYKFVIRNDDASDTWEDNIGGNRQYTVPPGGGTIDVVYFDNDAVVSIPVVQNILMKTNMSTYFGMGWFDPSLGDSIQVRGAFNSWAGDVCEDPLALLQYEYVEQSFGGFSGDNFAYKFYINIDDATGPGRFPGWAPGPDGDGWNYEHPAERGDGNRLYVLPPLNGDVGPEMYHYSDINPGGVLNSPDTVRVTLTADMAPAIAQGFNPDTDTVRVVWEDALWRSIQVLHQGSFPQVWDMQRDGMTTNYSLSFTVHGTTHYNMQYRLRFTGPAGEITEGGGLGVQNPYRSRFIQPLGPNSFPTTYSAPVDVFDIDGAPLPGETAPFNPVASVELEPELGQPVAFKLAQNYPNPFNPATRIRYTIPERSQVTLKIYNILGETVASLVNEVQEAGNYVALFEANTLASGVYFYKLEAGSFSQTRKMLLMK
jgi:hypothetical protein